MSNLKRPELNLTLEYLGSLFFNYYSNCIQVDYQDLAKDPMTAPVDHYKKPQL